MYEVSLCFSSCVLGQDFIVINHYNPFDDIIDRLQHQHQHQYLHQFQLFTSDMHLDGQIDWNTHQGPGFVRIDGRNMFFKVQGPLRSANQPIVICEAGHDDASTTWAAVQRLTSKFARILCYDRAGYRLSDAGSKPRVASTIAKELSDALDAAEIAGPFLLVCNSFGGILCREFMDLRLSDVCGIIFVDVIGEKYSAENWLPPEDFGAVLGSLDFWQVSGIKHQNELTREEWDEFVKVWPNNEATALDEQNAMGESQSELASKQHLTRQPMKDKPVTVIKGNATQELVAVLEAGEKAGNGTEEQRARLRELFKTSEDTRERHQREFLQLSSNSRYVVAPKGHHLVQLTEPELIVAEIQRMLQSL